MHFAAKDVLFKSRLLRFFLKRLGAVPIQRKMDHKSDQLSNDAAFDRLYEVLGAGRTMGIFPEGISHDMSQLQRLKTGAARIALGAANKYPQQKLRIIPCGLHYLTRDRFRSSVLVQFGEAIAIDEAWLAEYQADEREAVKKLTEDIQTRLLSLTVNAEDWDTVRVLDGVRRLYQPRRITIEERVELSRRFNREYPRVRNEPAVQALVARVVDYQDRLGAMGLSDRDLRRDIGVVEATIMVLRHFFTLVVWLPLALAGGMVHLPIAFLLGWGGERFAPRKDTIATTKFVAGLLCLLGLYIGLPLLLAIFVGPLWGMLAIVLLPLSGYATLRVLERAVGLQRVYRTSLRMLSFQKEVRHLRSERAALEAAVIAAVDRYRPEGLELMFPRQVLESEDVP